MKCIPETKRGTTGRVAGENKIYTHVDYVCDITQVAFLLKTPLNVSNVFNFAIS